MRAFTAFTGFGGVDIALRNLGVEVVGGIEYDEQIGAVAQQNVGDHIQIADVRAVDPHTLPDFDLFHASPSCKSFSIGGRRLEAEADIECAAWVASVIKAKQPKYFTLENVTMYRKSESWQIIRTTLQRLGYMTIEDQNRNAKHYGVPQDRNRMIVRASRYGLLSELVKQEPVGWFSAVEDIVDTFKPDDFAPWQWARFPDHPATHFLVLKGGNSSYREAKAGKSFRSANEPCTTVTGQSHPARTLVVQGANAGRPNLTFRTGEQQFYTVVSSIHGQPARTFVVSPDLNYDRQSLIVRTESEPYWTVRAYANTQLSRSYVLGDIRRLSIRALARMQTLPDDYLLPEHNKNLCCTGIGNMVPVKMYEAIAKPFLEM